MAKKKKRKSLLPKRIAGVKVPKSVRNGRLGELLASRTGQALLAEAVMAAGAVGVAKQAKGSADSAVADDLARSLSRWDGKHGAQARDSIIAFAITEGARAFVRALNQRRAESGSPGAPEAQAGAAEETAPQERPAAHWANETIEERGSKKKPISYEAGPL